MDPEYTVEQGSFLDQRAELRDRVLERRALVQQPADAGKYLLRGEAGQGDRLAVGTLDNQACLRGPPFGRERSACLGTAAAA